MPDRPSISVVIPAWNREATIAASIESIRRQSIAPDEIIVADDASTDRTVEIARSSGDPRVRIIALLGHSGAQAARNAAIRAATGDWIAFLDSDDEWHEEKLARQIEALRRFDFDPWTVVHTNVVRVDAAGNETAGTLPGLEGADVYQRLLVRPGALFFPSILASKAALERIGYLDERAVSFQEWDTALRLARFCRFVYLNEPLFTYHLHSGETISRDETRSIDGYASIIGKFESDIKGLCGSGAWDSHVLHLVGRSLDAGQWKRADRFFSMIVSRGWRFRVLQLCRYLHVSPFAVVRRMRRL